MTEEAKTNAVKVAEAKTHIEAALALLIELAETESDFQLLAQMTKGNLKSANSRIDQLIEKVE